MDETHFDSEVAYVADSIGGGEVLVGGMYIKIDEGPWDLSIRVPKKNLPKSEININKLPDTRAIAIVPKQEDDKQIWKDWLKDQNLDPDYVYPFIYRNRLHDTEGNFYPVAFNCDPLFGMMEEDLDVKISTSKGIVRANIHHYPDVALAKISDDEDVIASELL